MHCQLEIQRLGCFKQASSMHMHACMHCTSNTSTIISTTSIAIPSTRVCYTTILEDMRSAVFRFTVHFIAFHIFSMSFMEILSRKVLKRKRQIRMEIEVLIKASYTWFVKGGSEHEVSSTFNLHSQIRFLSWKGGFSETPNVWMNSIPYSPFKHLVHTMCIYPNDSSCEFHIFFHIC